MGTWIRDLFFKVRVEHRLPFYGVLPGPQHWELRFVASLLRTQGIPVRMGEFPDELDKWESVLRTSIRSLRARKRTLLLPGRDTWVWEVLAHKHHVPSVYIPEISREVARNRELLRELLHRNHVTEDMLICDTGFVGTIPRAISEAMGAPMDFVLLSQASTDWYNEPGRRRACPRVPQQMFPRFRESRKMALFVEYLPKRYQSGAVRDGKVVQELSDVRTTLQHLLYTASLWRGLPYHECARQVARILDT